VPRNIHADGQCSVPAGTNNSAPMPATQLTFCSNNLRSCRVRFPEGSIMIAPFSANLRRCV